MALFSIPAIWLIAAYGVPEWILLISGMVVWLGWLSPGSGEAIPFFIITGAILNTIVLYVLVFAVPRFARRIAHQPTSK